MTSAKALQGELLLNLTERGLNDKVNKETMSEIPRVRSVMSDKPLTSKNNSRAFCAPRASNMQKKPTTDYSRGFNYEEIRNCAAKSREHNVQSVHQQTTHKRNDSFENLARAGFKSGCGITDATTNVPSISSSVRISQEPSSRRDESLSSPKFAAPNSPQVLAEVAPISSIEDALELHRTKSYVVNLIDHALSNHFGMNPCEKCASKDVSNTGLRRDSAQSRVVLVV